MAIIRLDFCIRNVWGLASTLNYINILQPVYFNVFLHGNFLQCSNEDFFTILLMVIKPRGSQKKQSLIN